MNRLAPAEKSKRQGGHVAWTLAILFVATIGVVFTLSKTSTAAVEHTMPYNSPPPSPIESPTPTPTATATVSPLPSPTPLAEAINPSTGVTDRPKQINIYGQYFQSGARAYITWESHGQATGNSNTIQLDTVFIGPKHLMAVVPANIAKGLYGLHVTNPDNQTSRVLHTAYEAVSANPQETNDLKSRPENLWTTPNSLTAGESVSIGLTVFRVGGVGGLPPFAVDFYEDEIKPSNLIGRGIVTGISPDSSASTSAISWTPEAHGEINLFAVIDPEGQVAESNEQNNTVKRKVDVHYIQQTDITPPVAQKLLVNGGEYQVLDANVQLSIEAVDPEPNPTGVNQSYYVELQWASGVGSGGSWIPVKWTSWSSYASQPHTYELMPNSGLRYLQGWVADRAGNISAKPATERVNYVPATDTLLEGEIRVFRQITLAGQCLRVRVEPAGPEMDPDIYIWSPNYTPGSGAIGFSIQPAGVVDQVIIQPTQAGIYQIEIVAFTDATYTQSIEVMDSCTTGRMSDSPTVPADKQPRTEPSVPVEDVPVGDEAVPETIKQFLSFISVALQENTRSADAPKVIYLPTLNR